MSLSLEGALSLVVEYLQARPKHSCSIPTLIQNVPRVNEALRLTYGKNRTWRKFVDSHKTLLSLADENGGTLSLLTTDSETCEAGETCETVTESPSADPTAVAPTAPISPPQPVVSGYDDCGMDGTKNDRDNWLFLVRCLQKAPDQLKFCFKQRWRVLFAEDFSVTKFLPKFLERYPETTLRRLLSFEDQHHRVLGGQFEKWDISILAVLLTKLDWAEANKPAEDLAIKSILSFRNQIFHVTSFSDNETKELKSSLKKSLVELGMEEIAFGDLEVSAQSDQLTL